MTKSILRKQILDARKNLSAREFAFFCAAIFEEFKKLDLTGVKTLHLFLPILEKKEVNTWPILHWLQENYPAITLVVPRLVAGSPVLEHPALLPSSILVTNKWGIPEPVTGKLIDPGKIDLCLVPLLAADRSGHRIGYGGGFYDRFLAACSPEMQTVGLSLFEPLDEPIEVDEFDMALNSCIFPSDRLVFR